MEVISNMAIRHVYDDGGRKAAGYQGSTGDCVTRAIAIAMELPYQEVYDAMAQGNGTQRRSKHDRGKRSKTAGGGIAVTRKWFKDWMAARGWRFVATMTIGSGCKTHLAENELPKGRLIVSVSKHYTAVIDGVVRDTFDPSRGGTRCVYGYWTKA